MSGHGLFGPTALVRWMGFPLDHRLWKFFFMWALNALAYLIFALFCLLSNQGFNWWRDPQSIGFAYIHAIFAVQSLTQLIFVLVNELRKRKIPLEQRSYLDADSDWADLVYYANSTVFWIICGLYVLGTAFKPGSQEATKFMPKS